MTRLPHRRSALLLPLVLLPALLSGAPRAEELPGPITAEVLEVVDGDTLAVRVKVWLDQELQTRVRLDGIDTPEIRGKCEREKEIAREAHEALRRLVLKDRSRVVLRDVAYDKFGGRVRARVLLPDGTDVAQSLIGAGYARPYSGGARGGWCEVAQRP